MLPRRQMGNRRPFQSDLMGIPPATSGWSHALFFGLFPDANVRSAIDEIASMLESKHATSRRRINSDRQHMTLHFVGEFALRPDDVIDRLKRVGDEVLRRRLICNSTSSVRFRTETGHGGSERAWSPKNSRRCATRSPKESAVLAESCRHARPLFRTSRCSEITETYWKPSRSGRFVGTSTPFV